MELQTIIFISRSGGGKGTQARKLIEHLASKSDKRTFHMQSGNRIRSFLEESSYASKLAQEIGPKGDLQPAFLSVWAWAGEIIKKLDKDEHLVLDGTPRRLSEAKLVTEALHFFKRENVQVIYLDVSNDWSRTRLKDRKEGREDDATEDSINKRLAWFDTEVMPVIDYFKENNYYTVHEVNGERNIEEVHEDVIKALGF